MPSARHPKGLYILFFTEMWERFSFYGMRALLVLYLVNHLKWTTEDASRVSKWYMSLVYLTPLLGGYLADRYLGNKRAVIIGAVLMAIGHFLMAFEPMPYFYAALVFLIFGNGFFKPNMSTQVGRLYGPNDPRRDSAYTIFYMGINLGAFIAPLLCGWLQTRYSFHHGFAAAGVGMVCGLVIYLVGQRWVVEIDPAKAAAAGSAASSSGSKVDAPAAQTALSEAEAARSPSASPALNRRGPFFVTCGGAFLAVFVTLMLLAKWAGWSFGAWIAGDDLTPLAIMAICAVIASWILLKTQHGVRDRVLSIYVLFIFAVFFWGGAGLDSNVMNLWADKSTNRYVTQVAPPPSVFSAASEGEAAAATSTGLWANWVGLWNPVPTTWFQSINAFSIFLLGPVFSFLWIYLDRRKRQPSIPMKIALGVGFQSIAFAIMLMPARLENQPSSAKLDSLPASVGLNPEGQLCEISDDRKIAAPYHAGRLRYDSTAKTLQMMGVLPDIERDRIASRTAPANFTTKVKELQKSSNEVPQDKEGNVNVSVTLDEEPPGLDLRYAGLGPEKLSYDRAAKSLRTTTPLADQHVLSLQVAAAEPAFRGALNDLFVSSSAYRVSPWWLLWFYVATTLGELCLSPVGLSMVSKLAPARFATMLMGLWLLTNALGYFLAGRLAQIWGTVPPMPFFLFFVVALGAAAVVLFLGARKIVAMMHGVN